MISKWAISVQIKLVFADILNAPNFRFLEMFFHQNFQDGTVIICMVNVRILTSCSVFIHFKCLDVRDSVKDIENFATDNLHLTDFKGVAFVEALAAAVTSLTCRSTSVTPRWLIPPLHKVKSAKVKKKKEERNESEENETKTPRPRRLPSWKTINTCLKRHHVKLREGFTKDSRGLADFLRGRQSILAWNGTMLNSMKA